jgi:uroporphyrinogen-III decarboxylase
MTPEQRIRVALEGGTPDRVPVAPFIHYFAATYAGYSQAHLWEDHRAYREAMRKTFRDLGPWDASFLLDAHGPVAMSFLIPMKARIPGRDLPRNSPMQLIEEEVMLREDYDWLARQPSRKDWTLFGLFLRRLALRIHDPLGRSLSGHLQMALDLARNGVYNLMDIRMWLRWGITVLYGLGLEAPFDTLSLARSLRHFSVDILQHPDRIREATRKLVPGFLLLARAGCKATGIPRFIIMCHRSSNDFLSPRQFASLAFPSLKEICLALIREKIVPILHCDGNWDKNLDCFRELPTGRFCLQFDGRTDIFRASRILEGHCTLFGDVPASMLVLASPGEVDRYCKRLIKRVGANSAFILGAGCEIPSDARPANVWTLIRAVEKYGYYNAGA